MAYGLYVTTTYGRFTYQNFIYVYYTVNTIMLPLASDYAGLENCLEKFSPS